MYWNNEIENQTICYDKFFVLHVLNYTLTFH